jgi:hypothetical protein
MPWWVGPASGAATGAVLALGATWRLRMDFDSAPHARGYLARGGCVFVLWHARLLALTYAHRGMGLAVLISRHRDGELIARVVNRLGYVTPRGSSTRGGEAGALEMLRLARAGRPVVVTPDGPRGPARTVKPGAVFLASRAGIPVVPVSAASSRARVLDSWDRFRVPAPFAKVLVGYGPPIHVPPEIAGAETAEWCGRVGRALDEVTARVAAAVGERR